MQHVSSSDKASGFPRHSSVHTFSIMFGESLQATAAHATMSKFDDISSCSAHPYYSFIVTQSGIDVDLPLLAEKVSNSPCTSFFRLFG